MILNVSRFNRVCRNFDVMKAEENICIDFLTILNANYKKGALASHLYLSTRSLILSLNSIQLVPPFTTGQNHYSGKYFTFRNKRFHNNVKRTDALLMHDFFTKINYFFTFLIPIFLTYYDPCDNEWPILLLYNTEAGWKSAFHQFCFVVVVGGFHPDNIYHLRITSHTTPLALLKWRNGWMAGLLLFCAACPSSSELEVHLHLPLRLASISTFSNQTQ